MAQVDSRFMLGTRDWTEVDVPAHCSSLGKVFYAFDVLPIPPGPLERRTAATLADAEELRLEAKRIRAPRLGRSPPTSSRSGSPASPSPWSAAAPR